MKLSIIQYGGTEKEFIDVADFEFRTNQVTNWIKIKYKDGNTAMIHNVCVIKTL